MIGPTDGLVGSENNQDEEVLKVMVHALGHPLLPAGTTLSHKHSRTLCAKSFVLHTVLLTKGPEKYLKQPNKPIKVL